MPANGRAGPFVIGATHRSTTMDLRDRLFIDEGAAPVLFERLAEAGIGQALVLSTCDRVEVQGVADAPEAAVDRVRDILAARAGEDASAIADQFESFTGDAAVRRIFAVAASLESQVIGEPQVLGQVKEAHRLAAHHGMVGPELEALLQAAYGAAKRARTETSIAEQPVTLASGAVQIARDLHGDLSACSGLIVGLGDMGELVGGQLRLSGLGRMVLTGLSRRTEMAARRMGCHFAPFDDLDVALAAADIVVTAAGTGRYLITAEAMEITLKRRRRRPVLVIDGGIPGDVDPAVDRLEGAYVYTLDDLERVAREGRANREAAADAAWHIVDIEVAAWRRDRAERDAVPTVVALRRRFEALRDEVLAADPNLDAAEATRRLVNRLLHDPSEVLRALAADSEGPSDADAVHRMVTRMFRLDCRTVRGTEVDDGEE